MDKRKVITYISLTFAITWACWWGLAVLTNNHIVDSSQGIFTVIHLIGGFGPTIAAIALQPNKAPKAALRFVFTGNKTHLGIYSCFA